MTRPSGRPRLVNLDAMPRPLSSCGASPLIVEILQAHVNCRRPVIPIGQCRVRFEGKRGSNVVTHFRGLIEVTLPGERSASSRPARGQFTSADPHVPHMVRAQDLDVCQAAHSPNWSRMSPPALRRVFPSREASAMVFLEADRTEIAKATDGRHTASSTRSPGRALTRWSCNE